MTKKRDENRMPCVPLTCVIVINTETPLTCLLYFLSITKFTCCAERAFLSLPIICLWPNSNKRFNTHSTMRTTWTLATIPSGRITEHVEKNATSQHFFKLNKIHVLWVLSSFIFKTERVTVIEEKILIFQRVVTCKTVTGMCWISKSVTMKLDHKWLWRNMHTHEGVDT